MKKAVERIEKILSPKLDKMIELQTRNNDLLFEQNNLLKKMAGEGTISKG